jgi:predicted Zn-ribbon and HTH transcriptional regulator
MKASEQRQRDGSCSGKQLLDDFHHAKRVAAKMRQKFSARIQPYRCRHCQHWHVGEHVPNPKDRRRDQEIPG